MNHKKRYSWHLEELMHARGIHQMSALQRELQSQGIDMSSSQMHRLVTSSPDRLNLDVLAALCEVLSCSPDDLIEIHVESRRKVASEDNVVALADKARPRRAKVMRDTE